MRDNLGDLEIDHQERNSSEANTAMLESRKPSHGTRSQFLHIECDVMCGSL
jgi:hypothetical protein